MKNFAEPDQHNDFLEVHAGLLLDSLQRLTGKAIVERSLPLAHQAQQLFHAACVVASHDTAADPVFNYGNRAALHLWETSWTDFVTMPSRASAEAVEQEERRRLLDTVSRQGFIDNYQGIRISAQGRRFMVKHAIVWNVLDEAGQYHGQAVMFRDWEFL